LPQKPEPIYIEDAFAIKLRPVLSNKKSPIEGAQDKGFKKGQGSSPWLFSFSSRGLGGGQIGFRNFFPASEILIKSYLGSDLERDWL
jgi:hypothetical protein